MRTAFFIDRDAVVQSDADPVRDAAVYADTDPVQ